MQNRYLFIVLFGAWLLSGNATFAETVYVCKGEGEGGSTLFSERPCRSGQGVRMEFPDSYTVGEGLSELEKQNLEAIRERERRQQQPEETETPVSDETTAALSENGEIDEAACSEAKARLKQWEKVMALGYPPEEKATYEKELVTRNQARDEACGMTGR